MPRRACLAEVPADGAQSSRERVRGADECSGGRRRVLAGPTHAHHRPRAHVGHQGLEEGPLPQLRIVLLEDLGGGHDHLHAQEDHALILEIKVGGVQSVWTR